MALSGREAISALYRYTLVLCAREPALPVDPDDLVGQRATLRILTQTEPQVRYVHGIVTEAEESGSASSSMLYQVTLEPPLVRLAHRTRSRIFLEKTTRQILEEVLLGDPLMAAGDVPFQTGDSLEGSFIPAAEQFAFRLLDPRRITDVTTRSYCVQYNESDLAFLSRLLEEEGLRYHFENSDSTCLLVISDNDAGALRHNPSLPIGAEMMGRELTSIQLGRRLRASKVSHTDYNWKKPSLSMAVDVPSKGAGGDLFESTYPGLYPDAPDQGKPLAEARLGRLQSEARYALLSSTCRALSAGSIIRVDHANDRYDGEYLATALDVRGETPGELPPGLSVPLTGTPYSARIECARRGKNGSPAETGFRPARITPKPCIVGSQTAFVTAEPSNQGAEIHVGGPPGAEIGCVRLKFHWDLEVERHAKEPTSCWVRVSQMFAGVGEGGVWHPRVGTEVVAEFLDGDPDRPMVTGRVYNGKNRPPAPGSGSPTISTFKSMSSPGGGVHNELMFDDAAGNEQVKLHAGKDYNAEVGHDRSESITNNSTSSVGVDRTESSGNNRSTSVGVNNTETVGNTESVSIGVMQNVSVGNTQMIGVGVNQSLSVGVNQMVNVGVTQIESIGAVRSVTVGVSDSLVVGASQSIAVTGHRSDAVLGTVDESVVGAKTVNIVGPSTESILGPQTLMVTGPQSYTVVGPVSRVGTLNMDETVALNATVSAGVNLTLGAGAQAALGAPAVFVNAEGELVLTGGGATIKLSGAGVEISGATVKISGGSVDVTGGTINLN
ncbi:type VI secretion system Vgr family protein [Chondromyces apiculatus]|uniref:type VI secretion system Vgr family protein n=1 Tax=Chondromyces apiculatus TaxID=51 RepID=UPI001E2B0091|nr:type VI secretion system tip protein TssI/VgrG [Chondromyces apiculatus]